jgi:hypothetical protein
MKELPLNIKKSHIDARDLRRKSKGRKMSI